MRSDSSIRRGSLTLRAPRQGSRSPNDRRLAEQTSRVSLAPLSTLGCPPSHDLAQREWPGPLPCAFVAGLHPPLPAILPTDIATRRAHMKLPKALRRSPQAVANPRAEAFDAQRLLLQLADPADRRVVEAALPYSVTGVPRLLSLVDAVRYCVARGIPGAFAECGVWRGGSILAMILTLQDLGCADRHIYLYDTFEGMTEPTELDVSPVDPPALTTWRKAQKANHRPWPEYFEPEAFNEDSVRATLRATGYPEELLHFVRGAVEETIPGTVPDRLALLRLDTDWYESTRHELQHLFPLLTPGGVLIVDDYGHWQGARRAVDEYFSKRHSPLLLNRIDYTARIAVKQ